MKLKLIDDIKNKILNNFKKSFLTPIDKKYKLNGDTLTYRDEHDTLKWCTTEEFILTHQKIGTIYECDDFNIEVQSVHIKYLNDLTLNEMFNASGFDDSRYKQYSSWGNTLQSDFIEMWDKGQVEYKWNNNPLVIIEEFKKL